MAYLYSHDDMVAICDRIEMFSISVEDACNREKYPNSPTSTCFYQWLAKDKELVKKYARATEERAEVLFEQACEILDEPVPCNERGLDAAAVADKRLRFDGRKWIIGKLKPKKYGDSVDITSGHDKIQQVPATLSVRIVKPDAAD